MICVVRRLSWDTIVLNLGPAGEVLRVLRVRFLKVLPALGCQRALAKQLLRRDVVYRRDLMCARALMRSIHIGPGLTRFRVATEDIFVQRHIL